MKHTTALLGGIITAILLAACNNFFHDLIPPDDTLILFFEVPGQTGEAVITEDTVTVVVGKGAEVNAVVPTVRVSRMATLLPVTLDYVSAAFPSVNLVETAMKMNKSDDVNNYVIDLIRANPDFNVPALAIPIDFTGPVTMLVVGGLGSIRQYTVYVAEDSGEPRLLNIRFSKYDNAELISDAPCVIDEARSAVYTNAVYPMEMDYLSCALVPSFVILGDSLTVDGTPIVSGVNAIQFDSYLGVQTKTITITREGANRDYTLTVLFSEDPDTIRSITDFRFNKADNAGISANAVASIINTENTGTITVQVFYSGAMPSTLTPRFISPGNVSVGGVTQTTGANSRDFSSPVEYRVVSKNGMYSRVYTVKVEFISVANNTPRITAFRFSCALNAELVQDAAARISDGLILIDVHYGGSFAPASLKAEFSAGGIVTVNNSVQVSGASAQDFTRQVKYTVTNPEYPALSRDYWVQTRMLQDTSSYAAITSFGFYNEDNPGLGLAEPLIAKIDQTTGKITVYAPIGSGLTANIIAPRYTAAGQVSVNGTPQVSGVSGRVFDAPVTYTVISANGNNRRDYTVSVRELKSPIYVNQNAFGYGDGTSWENAFTSLKAACEAASQFPEAMSKEIWIATGTYTPGFTPEDYLPLTANTSYIGGFAGWETNKNQRNAAANTVVVSGDLGGGVYANRLFCTVRTEEIRENILGQLVSVFTYAPLNGDLSFEDMQLKDTLGKGGDYGIYCTGTPGKVLFSNITANNISGSYAVYISEIQREVILKDSNFANGAGVCLPSSASARVEVSDSRFNSISSTALYVSGGNISINRVNIDGVQGNGIILFSTGTATVYNSTIRNCSYSGLTMNGTGSKEISGNTISGTTDGAGLNVSGGTVTMNSGTISNNTAQIYSYGGGVDLWEGTFIMNGGSISNNNGRSCGGGVHVSWDSTFIMRNGAVISGNRVASVVGVSNGYCFGGGVAVGGTFRMEGGSIYNNSTDSNGYGGGVMLAFDGEEGIFIMSGGTISGNTSGQHGGGVYVYGGNSFSKTGGTIYGSDGGSNANRSGNNLGHAAYVGSTSYNNTF